ncbi:FAD-dependent oxidoreductase [Siccirubricoccus deserti]|uniref:NAD(P)-binding domain-containing protein n=1 Tax=Siccirubricoccus deserti TaxID=2013562 RepID=A0A9X0QZR9_9PROT|nr:NAD(P)-binding domain-containing protein [Siccirubricoccus deserti]MBC4016665.1 NAD(P)-binding domain-containing protein [Siccirubricoccus deserti]GGC50924.1 FAD-dependent oxidoreductase [Siccirubricoccus deserti]
MRQTDAIIIGAGQAGLAMSHCLARHGVDHVILERGRTAERWRSERWDSLRLLTPNWMSRLPGWSYRGTEPDGYMTMPEVVRYLDAYAEATAAPVEAGTAVHALRRTAGGYAVETSRGAWRTRVVVVATGHCDVPAVPAMAGTLPAAIHQVTPSGYRNPASLPEGGVLVVGASASGVQLAEEIHRSGRPVSLAVGRHLRLLRRYRGRDIMAWLERAGLLDETAEAVRDLAQARAQPSLQLVGRADPRGLDLGVLQGMGVRLLGRATGVEGGVLHLADDLAGSIAAAQRSLGRVLTRVDAVADRMGVPAEAWPPAIALAAPAPARLDLRAAGIRSVVWATGFRRDYGWLQVPVLDAEGEVIHRGGITPAPGLYVLGLRFLRRRRSSFIDGVGADAEALGWHILGQLATGRAAA